MIDRTELMEKFLLHQAVADTLEEDGLSAEEASCEAEKRVYSSRLQKEDKQEEVKP